MSNTTPEVAIGAGVPATGQTMLADITHDFHWADGTLQYYLGGPEVLTFDPEFNAYYNGTPTDYYSGSPDASFAFETQTVRAFDMIDSVIATDFTRVLTAATAQTTADLVIVSSSTSDEAGLEGFFRFPGDATRAANDYWSLGVFSSHLDVMTANPERGGGEYRNWTIIHEIGHGLGIYHPFQGDAATSVGSAMDNERYTVMSYTGSASATTYGHAVTMMALDIAALQAQYGQESYATGNSTYTLFDAAGGDLSLAEGAMSIGRAYATIWDTGGSGDTIRYGNTDNSVLINLNDATLDRSGVAADAAPAVTALQHTSIFSHLDTALQTSITSPDYHAGGFFSQVLTEANGTYSAIDGGFAIARGVQIENARGGNERDVLIGNEQANTLVGLEGNDTLIGSGGNDTLDGGEGCDTASFSGAYAEYTITENENGTVTVAHSGADGTDTLKDMEFLQFSDQRVSLVAEALDFTEVTSSAFVDYGANVLYRNDDGNSGAIDISSIFEDGILIDGLQYDAFYVNTNGNVTFGGGLSTYTPTGITGAGREIIAPYWADVDTRNPTEGTNPGNVYWDFNEDRDSIIVTWDNVGYYSRRTDLLSSFQLELVDRGCGNVEIIFRYENISWTAGEASGGTDGLGGTTSRAGFSLGDTYFELPASGNEAAMLNLENAQGNLSVSGVWQFIVSGGEVQGVGGAEDDLFEGDDGNDNYLGGQGNDTVSGGGGNDSLFGGQGDDNLDGGEGNDSLDGGSGQDTVNGGPGDDLLVDGGTDDDLFDVLYGGDGNDFMDGGYGNDSMRGDAGNDTMIGGHGSDTVIGGAGDDVLTGQTWSDLMFGGDGDDFINGGFGHDRVNGGAGADRFYHLGVEGHGSDWIQDYDSEEGDLLVYGGTTSINNFQVNFAETPNAGVSGVEEAFVIFRPTGQILWALVDGAAQEHINMQMSNGVTYDLLSA
ncbi:nidogen-like domain-containing protein [Maritimibacter alkaliphilus]|uniref:nidogen-like domain-containing protein n=1 Tax=Maritimibacter alkaliphilus TaxID=404236 RepID=UPI001C978C2A|nr:nidogen-like domain-containing protein [Maritimibacter alkaliphilus]MBY6092909.1 M10 family metallopeptidase C-terminal domain-containing protein [Maritimibacter alkaliphilus]